MAIRVALYGCGFMGSMHASCYRLLPDVEIAALIDVRPEAAAKIGGAPTFSTLAEAAAGASFDVVDVCLPTDLHRQATIEAANLGKHVLCEKPMALNLEDADAMIEAANRNGITLMIAHCIRFWPEYAELRRVVEAGELGRLLSLNLTRYGEFPHWSSQNWLADEARSGGGVLDMHIHDTDYALFLKGKPQSSRSAGTVDARGPSHVFTTMRYGDCVIHTEGGWNLPSHAPFNMSFRAIFENGAMMFDHGPLTTYRPGQPPQVFEAAAMKAEGGGNISDLGGYFAEIAYFVDCLKRGEKPTLVAPESARESLAFALEEIRQIKGAV